LGQAMATDPSIHTLSTRLKPTATSPPDRRPRRLPPPRRHAHPAATRHLERAAVARQAEDATFAGLRAGSATSDSPRSSASLMPAIAFNASGGVDHLGRLLAGARRHRQFRVGWSEMW
jgi:hypothetical protein